MKSMEDRIKKARQVAEDVYMLGGPDMRYLPDEELVEIIEEATLKMAEALSKTGVAAAEACKALRLLAKSH